MKTLMTEAELNKEIKIQHDLRYYSDIPKVRYAASRKWRKLIAESSKRFG